MGQSLTKGTETIDGDYSSFALKSEQNPTQAENEFQTESDNARLVRDEMRFHSKEKMRFSLSPQSDVSSALSHFCPKPPHPRKTTAKPANVISIQKPCQRHFSENLTLKEPKRYKIHL